MAEYTPDDDYVRTAYIDRRDFLAQVHHQPRPGDEATSAEFDRWLARKLPTRDEIAEALHEVGCDGSGCKPRWIDRVNADAVLELLKGEGRG